MSSGPLQLLVIGFDKLRLDGSIVAVLAPLAAQRLIRLIDVLGIHKDREGAIWSIGSSDLAAVEAIQAGDEFGLPGRAIRALIGLAAAAEYSAAAAVKRQTFGLTPENILEIAERMPAGSDALLMLVEHTWLIPLRDAFQAQDGSWIADDFLSLESIRGIDAALAVTGRCISQ